MAGPGAIYPFGVAPGSTTAALPPRLAATPRRGFVGRVSELAALEEVIADVRAGRGPRVALVAGEQGAGKTSLVAEAARAAARQGCTVAYGRGEEGLDLPFGAWHQALGSSWPERHERDELFAAVTDHLAAVAAASPLVVVLDDLQWADQATLLLVRAVIASTTSPLALLLSYRSTEADPASPLGALLAHLAREPDVERVELAGLAPEDVEALAAADGDVDRETRLLATRVWTDSGGNAFFVNALLDELEATPARASTSTLREVIGHRVARLGDEAASVLRAASVLGEVFSVETLAAVTGVEEALVVDALERAVADGLVTETPLLGFSFVHALVADTLAAGLSGPKRRALHRAAADNLAAQETDPAAVAGHLAAARPDDRAGRERAVDAAIAAGQRALDQLAYEDAVSGFANALAMIERWGLDDHRRCTALLSLVRAQRLAGDPDKAVAVAATAIDLAVRLERWDDVARTLRYFPRTAEAFPDPALISVLERAADLAPGASPVRALAVASLARVLSWTGDWPRIRALAEEAVARADANGDRAARAYTRGVLLVARGGEPGPGRDLELAREIEALMRPDDEFAVRTEYELLLRRAHALFRMGDLDAVERELQRGQALDRRRRRDHLRWWVLGLRTVRAILEGRLAEAQAFSDATDAVGAPYGQISTDSARLAHSSAIAYLRGGFGDMAPALADFTQRFPIAGLRAVLVGALALAGRATEARELLRDLARDGYRTMPRDDSWTTAAFMLAEACRLLDARQEAEALYDALEPHAGEYVVLSGMAACFGPVDYSLGQLAVVLGRDDRARRHLENAARLNARIGARPFLALTRVEQAALGVPGAAEEARSIASELGIEVVLQRLALLEAPSAPAAAELRHQGGVWTLSFGGSAAQLKDLRGLHYLSALLTRPGQELLAVELQGGPGGGGTPVLDETARRAYRRRLAGIEAALEDAEAFSDAERAARATEERQALADELARAVGLGGRSRTMGSDAERARLNVSRAIRAAIDRIAEVHPELGRHLRLAVRTGAYCAYEPDPGLDVSWTLRS